MCTLSWHITPTHYILFFNRDEQRTRVKAEAPQLISSQNTQTIMPIDPQGGGTWISTNEHGLSLCLLNLYQGDIPPGKLTSRGQLVKELSVCKSLKDVDKVLSDLQLNAFAPFSLVIFDFELLSNGKHIAPELHEWNGHVLERKSCSLPFTSSSVKFELVQKMRLAHFAHLMESVPKHDTDLAEQRLLDYHRSHDGEPGFQSVCLHRDDATSVSLSSIRVDAEGSEFAYFDGSPCTIQDAKELSKISLTRI